MALHFDGGESIVLYHVFERGAAEREPGDEEQSGIGNDFLFLIQRQLIGRCATFLGALDDDRQLDAEQFTNLVESLQREVPRRK